MAEVFSNGDFQCHGRKTAARYGKASNIRDWLSNLDTVGIICDVLDNQERVERVKFGEYMDWVKQHYGEE